MCMSPDPAHLAVEDLDESLLKVTEDVKKVSIQQQNDDCNVLTDLVARNQPTIQLATLQTFYQETLEIIVKGSFLRLRAASYASESINKAVNEVTHELMAMTTLEARGLQGNAIIPYILDILR
jgi:hypothetical protein